MANDIFWKTRLNDCKEAIRKTEGQLLIDSVKRKSIKQESSARWTDAARMLKMLEHLSDEIGYWNLDDLIDVDSVDKLIAEMKEYSVEDSGGPSPEDLS